MTLRLLIIGIFAIALFWLGWNISFGTRKRKTSKVTRKAHRGFKERISLSAIRERNEKFMRISRALNFIPIGRLTKEKKEEIDRFLATAHKGDSSIRIAEEIHVAQWAYVMCYLVFVIVLMFIWKGFGILVLGCPLVFRIPLLGASARIDEENAILETEFMNFFSIYYVQFKRLGTSLRLSDVIQSYKNIAPYEMQVFVSRIEVDLASGEAYALKMLDRRYCHNPDVHRFCALAATVSRGDARAEKVVESFQTELEHKSIERRRAVVKKRMEMVEKVQAALLYTVVTMLMIIVFIHVAIG